MAAAYSIDLRKKILSAWQGKEDSQRGLAKRFKVSFSFRGLSSIGYCWRSQKREMWENIDKPSITYPIL